MVIIIITSFIIVIIITTTFNIIVVNNIISKSTRESILNIRKPGNIKKRKRGPQSVGTVGMDSGDGATGMFTIKIVCLIWYIFKSFECIYVIFSAFKLIYYHKSLTYLNE